MNRRHRSDGPFRSTHGVAITLFAETIGGLAVFTRLGPKGKGILLKCETEYIKKVKGIFMVVEKDLIQGSVIGFAAFDPEEKYHKLDKVQCDVVLKDTLGEVVAKVSLPLEGGTDKQCILTFKVEGMEIHNMRE